MTIYEKELQELKTWDEIQSTSFPDFYQGYPKINTAGHGYLVVMSSDSNYSKALPLASFIGKKAVYLEEDCEAFAFIKLIQQLT